MIVMIDNYDSFTWNLVQLVEEVTRQSVQVLRNDAFDERELLATRPAAIIISPGPGTPARSGRIVPLIRQNLDIPLLGVCLGHQAIGEAFGGEVVPAPLPVHGKVSDIRHEGTNLFEGCPTPMRAARYHSLVIHPKSLPNYISVDARSDDGAVMAMSHRSRPVFGIQFHPESFGTTGGEVLIANFARIGRIA